MAFSGLQKTRLGLAAFARSLYGSFVGKAENIPPITLTGGVTVKSRLSSGVVTRSELSSGVNAIGVLK